jgi:hypothetical protein
MVLERKTMAIDYDQAGALQTNLAFGQRVQVATVKFARYIQAEPTNTPRHFAGLRWAAEALRNPDILGRQIQRTVVWEPQIQDADIDPSDGDSTVDDAGLQTAVETVANTLI